MKTLLLLIILIVVGAGILAFGIGVSFVIGGFVTTVFHASDAGLALFILGSIAWIVWLASKMLGGLARACRS